jgi:hypothetical protein
MKIFVDFDDVIFNAKRFKEDLIRIFVKNGISRHEFENSYYTFQKKAQAEGKFYDPKKQIEVLRRKGQIDHEKLKKDIDGFMKDLSSYVFPDTYDFLKVFSKKDLFLMSYGHEKHQRNKIKGAKISKFFSKSFITRSNKIENILRLSKELNFKKNEKIILIDDRPEQIERAEQKMKKIVTFRMSRKEGRYSDLICLDKDYEVKNFKEALVIIQKMK